MTESNKLVMDDKYITENDIVKRYLHNKLTPEETVEFEEYILDKPELLEQLELDSVLVKTLPEAFESEQTVNQGQAKKSQDMKPSFWQVLLGTPIKASLATGFACLVVVSLIIPTGQRPSSAISENLEIYYLSELRGSTNAYEQKLDIATSTNTVIFVLNVDMEEPTPFIVKLIHQDTGNEIPLAKQYISSAVSELYISLDHTSLPKGQYQFMYYPKGKSEESRTSKLVIN